MLSVIRSSRNTRSLAAVFACSTFLFSGCADTSAGKMMGDLGAKVGLNRCEMTGAVAGGLIGGVGAGLLFGGGNGKILAGLLGAGIGAVVGTQIGKSMDCHDQQAAAAASTVAADLPVGKPVIWGAENAKVDQGVIQDLKREELAKTAPTPDNGVVAPVKKKKPAPKPDVAAAPEPSAPGRQAQTVEAVKIADNSLNKPIGSQLAPAQGGAPASPGSGAWGYSIPKTTAAKTADGRTCRQVQTVTFSGTDRYDHVSDMCLTPEGQWLADTQNGADKNKG